MRSSCGTCPAVIPCAGSACSVGLASRFADQGVTPLWLRYHKDTADFPTIRSPHHGHWPLRRPIHGAQRLAGERRMPVIGRVGRGSTHRLKAPRHRACRQ